MCREGVGCRHACAAAGDGDEELLPAKGEGTQWLLRGDGGCPRDAAKHSGLRARLGHGAVQAPEADGMGQGHTGKSAAQQDQGAADPERMRRRGRDDRSGGEPGQGDELQRAESFARRTGASQPRPA